MAVEIITGHTGKEHVTAEAAGALHAGVIGTGLSGNCPRPAVLPQL